MKAERGHGYYGRSYNFRPRNYHIGPAFAVPVTAAALASPYGYPYAGYGYGYPYGYPYGGYPYGSPAVAGGAALGALMGAALASSSNSL